VSPDSGGPDLSSLYLDTYARFIALVAELDAAALATPVPACPGWSVRDVVAHEVGITEDALTGRLTGPPSDEQTAAQVARFRGRGLPGMLATWAQTAPRFAEAAAMFRVWPAVFDVASHEQDIRGALGRPGARDTAVIRLAAERLIKSLDPPVPIRISVEDADFRAGPEVGPELGLATCRFEAFRWRMGRRSRAQLAALDWTGDPGPVLDGLAIFGPSPVDIIE
jgi:uncharacterized protein (TIGR03083 family)